MTSRDVFLRIALEKHLDESSRGVTDFMVHRHRGRQKRRKKLRTARVGGSHADLGLLLSLLVVRQRSRFFSPSSRFSQDRVSLVSSFDFTVVPDRDLSPRPSERITRTYNSHKTKTWRSSIDMLTFLQCSVIFRNVWYAFLILRCITLPLFVIS